MQPLMQQRALKLSILDRSPIIGGETSAEALRHTVELAQKAEGWGYHRFWVSEHHGSERVMGSSPEVLISHILAKTARIRVGSGGVMLQHYSPYKVAENFNASAEVSPLLIGLRSRMLSFNSLCCIGGSDPIFAFRVGGYSCPYCSRKRRGEKDWGRSTIRFL